jgi:hypothetical protein
MGLSVVGIKKLKGGNFYQQISEITFDNSYATGGESLTPLMLGLHSIDFMEIEPAGGYIFEYDHDNEKIKVLTPVGAIAAHDHTFTGAELTKTPTLIEGEEPAVKLLQNDAGTLKSTDATAISLGTPAGTISEDGAVAAKAAAEVAAETDLHTLVTRVKATGW